MRKIKEKFKTLSRIQKGALIIAMFLTIAVMITVPVVAWFTNQKKVAELYKIKYPNSLYLNAAQREDQEYFEMDTVDITEYQVDRNGNYITDENGVALSIDHKDYVFAVSGSNTDYFTLQLAHTNNNLFTYQIYEATQYDTYDDVPAEKKDTCIHYQTHADSHTEIGDDFVVEGDAAVNADGERWYAYGRELTGEPTVTDGEVAYPNGVWLNPGTGKMANNDLNNYYYKETYGTYGTVEAHAVPSYWQAVYVPTSLDEEAAANKKNFCRYFIVRITWDASEQSANETKESDMVYISVERAE